jgi:hypothetical protein
MFLNARGYGSALRRITYPRGVNKTSATMHVKLTIGPLTDRVVPIEESLLFANRKLG